MEEAALKASGPMPCALLIVTSAFLSSNSDWWVCRGGGVFFRGDGERLVVKNSVLKSHLSCQRADTGHPGTRGLWCSESGHWPSFPPLLPPTNPPPPPSSCNIPPTKHSSAAPSHLFFTVNLTSMNCPPPPPPTPPLHTFTLPCLAFFLASSFSWQSCWYLKF